MGLFLQFLPAIFSAIATAFAAFAAWQAPKAAAKLAEELRRQTEAENDSRRNKLSVFGAIMESRGALTSHRAVGALNLIDIVFHDNKPVREAWAELYRSFDPSSLTPPHAREEKIRRLILEMANDLGMADSLSYDDIGRIYYPNAIADEDRVADLERQAALKRLQHERSESLSNSAEPIKQLWPPKPGRK